MNTRQSIQFSPRTEKGSILNPANLFPFVDGQYLEQEKVDTGFPGSSPAVAPDESYLIFVCTDRDNGHGGDDLYISFQNKDGSWTEAQNMGNRINSSSHDLWPSVSSDGKYIFFVSFRNGNADVYWVNAKIIEELKINILHSSHAISPDGRKIAFSLFTFRPEASLIRNVIPEK
jgi:Tol biopolymer transport system component